MRVRESYWWRSVLHDKLRDWLVKQMRAAGITCSHEDAPPHPKSSKQGDIVLHRGGTLGAHTVPDVSRPHTHSQRGEGKDKVLDECAATKYRTHQRAAAYKAIGFDFCPFAVDILG